MEEGSVRVGVRPQIITKAQALNIQRENMELDIYNVDGYKGVGVARVVKKDFASDCHPDNDLLDYVISGSGAVEIDGEKFDVKAGDLVFIPRGSNFTWSAGVELLAIMQPRFEG